jgi:hypothetical protein
VKRMHFNDKPFKVMPHNKETFQYIYKERSLAEEKSNLLLKIFCGNTKHDKLFTNDKK